jgi:hypothetical protein
LRYILAVWIFSQYLSPLSDNHETVGCSQRPWFLACPLVQAGPGLPCLEGMLAGFILPQLRNVLLIPASSWTLLPGGIRFCKSVGRAKLIRQQFLKALPWALDQVKCTSPSYCSGGLQKRIRGISWAVYQARSKRSAPS